jgi:hypothetical protein
MRYRVALLALVCLSTPAIAACETPAYVDYPGSRAVSLTMLPFSAAVTVLSLPTGLIGAATGHPTLIEGTTDTFCYTTGFAGHVVHGRR